MNIAVSHLQLETPATTTTTSNNFKLIAFQQMCSSNNIVMQLLLASPHLPSLTERGKSKEQKMQQQVNADLVKARNKRREPTTNNKWGMQKKVSCLCTNRRELA
jgi:hypothetical protein